MPRSSAAGPSGTGWGRCEWPALTVAVGERLSDRAPPEMARRRALAVELDKLLPVGNGEVSRVLIPDRRAPEESHVKPIYSS